jgi:ethanolamine utilization protein EutM
MAKQAVGLLETRGLACLVVGVDAMLKSANVELAGPMKQAASACGEVVSAHVIARPDDSIDGVLPKDTSAAARAPRK